MKLNMAIGACAAMLFATCARGGGTAKVSADTIPAEDGDIVIQPLNHATFALQWKDTEIYVDPVGSMDRFKGLPSPTLILLTDIHQDHFNNEVLSSVVKPETKLVAPPATAEKLTAELRKQGKVLKNGEKATVSGIQIEAIPAYNITPERMKFHEKGRGNGYVLTLGGKRVYISGDTENIPEMRALKDIDVAFLCMNLPYTMTVEQAAEAVRAFKPKIVYPYHYRGSDVEKFKKLVGTDAGVDVRLKDWYAMP